VGVKETMSGAIYPSLKDKRVVVTGGASGIGAGLVSAFAAQGAKVTFLDILEKEARELVAELKGSAYQPSFQPCDLRDPDQVARVFAKIGTVDVLVNNAGNDDRHSLDDVTPAYWEERIAVNLGHILFCTRAVVAGMKAQRSGAIINFGSISWHMGLPDLVVYETAKAGIEGMGRALARELGPDGIRVTTVVPGNVRTPRQMKWYSPEAEAEIVDAQCLKRRIEPSHVASLVLFLASDDAGLCTGHEYWIDAGWR
jgi:NAD(P)-dependent dehydrogenase (short-subunit alcohol dehydrogenase family)